MQRSEKSESANVPVGASSVPMTEHLAAASSKAPERLRRASVLASQLKPYNEHSRGSQDLVEDV